MNENPNSVQVLSAIAAILQALAWPLVVALLFIVFRARISVLLDVLTKKLATATKLKAWQFEMETAEQDVKDAVEKVGQAARSGTLEAENP